MQYSFYSDIYKFKFEKKFKISHLLNNKKATSKVNTTLNNCAIKKANKGFLLLLLNKSLKLVSKPILVKAKANHNPCKFFNPSLTISLVSAERIKEKSREATINPMTNLGKRSQITPKVGLETSVWSDLLCV